MEVNASAPINSATILVLRPNCLRTNCTRNAAPAIIPTDISSRFFPRQKSAHRLTAANAATGRATLWTN